jgi:hypothetical protein
MDILLLFSKIANINIINLTIIYSVIITSKRIVEVIYILEAVLSQLSSF